MKKPINEGDRVLIETAYGLNFSEQMLTVVVVSNNFRNYSGTDSCGHQYYFTRRQVLKVWRKKPRKTADEIVEELWNEYYDSDDPILHQLLRKALMMRPPKS